ncbi:MAG: ChbG/HpnK family deacetylase, partial [Verrucomicrobiae bacterium]|nr:ChbG/HpnK family deacetylase [Verrucomicrobiae bacterium]
MAHHESGIRLVVTADDFGKSEAVNLAVETAHRRGIVTCASLMVTGEAFDQAVRIAKANPDLGVGLHLTLVCGRSCLGHERSTGLVDEEGRFADQPVWSGMRYFFNRDLRSRLADEIAAQFRAFERTGLPMDHVNGHLNIHLHPTVLDLVLPFVTGRRPVPMRLTRDPFW